MGTPTAQQLYAMNPFYDAGGDVIFGSTTGHNSDATSPCAAVFMQVPPLKWSKVLRDRWSAEERLLYAWFHSTVWPCIVCQNTLKSTQSTLDNLQAEEILGAMLQLAAPACQLSPRIF